MKLKLRGNQMKETNVKELTIKLQQDDEDDEGKQKKE